MDEQRIAESPLFSVVTRKELPGLLAALGVRERSYGRGERVLTRGETLDRIAFVTRGRVQMESSAASGDVQVLGWAGPGELFAEAYGVLGDEPLMVDVVAVEPSTVGWLPLARLRALADKDSPLQPAARAVERALVGELARRSVGLSRRAAATAPRTVRGRVTAYLEGRGWGDGWVELPRTRQVWARYLGVSRCALATELSKMAREGLIELDGRRCRLR